MGGPMVHTGIIQNPNGNEWRWNGPGRMSPKSVGVIYL